jgi:hypothetical protein
MHRPDLQLGDPRRQMAPDGIDYELAQEMASALGRHGRALDAALTALRAFDASATPGSTGPGDRSTRTMLVRTAADAFWCFIVQREACGLRDAQVVLEYYKVPSDVLRQAGIAETLRPSMRARWAR